MSWSLTSVSTSVVGHGLDLTQFHYSEKVLERGEKIELLVDKTDQLNQTSVNFRKKATQLKRSMWWKNVKLTIMIILILIVCTLFFINNLIT